MNARIEYCKSELYTMYSEYGLATKIYTYLRINTGLLFEIEKYVPRSGKILDVGCGYGIFSNMLCLMSPERSVMGFDISAERIAVAKNTIKNTGHLSFCVGDVNSFHYNNISIITIVDLLHHLPYQEQDNLLKIIYNNLETPGLLVLKDMGKKPLWKYFFHYLQDSISYRSKLFFRAEEELVELLGKIGFTATSIPLKSFLPYSQIVYLCKK